MADLDESDRARGSSFERVADWHSATQPSTALTAVAGMVLLAVDGMTNRRIAVEVGMGEHHVGGWLRRFAERRLAGLEDAPLLAGRRDPGLRLLPRRHGRAAAPVRAVWDRACHPPVHVLG